MTRRKGQVVTDTIEVRSCELAAGGSGAVRPSLEQLAVQLMDRARDEGVSLVGPGGLLAGLTKTVLESALDGELTEHLGYDAYESAGHHSGNSRNGTRKKTVLTEIGPIELEVPRDRAGSFEPVIVPKRRRRLNGVDALVCSLSAKGLTHGENRGWFPSRIAGKAGHPSSDDGGCCVLSQASLECPVRSGPEAVGTIEPVGIAPSRLPRRISHRHRRPLGVCTLVARLRRSPGWRRHFLSMQVVRFEVLATSVISSLLWLVPGLWP
jgi:hypothetical protein